MEQSVDEIDTIKGECLETEVDRAVEALADDEPNQPEASATTEEEGKTENGARQRKKKNFNLKKQLSKADTKLRDLFAPVSRRGSGASGGTGGGAGGLVSPHLPDSKPVSPQEEHPAFRFPEPVNCYAALPPLPPLPATDPLDSVVPPRTHPEIPLFDADGNPVRPPRRLKKSLSAAAATQPKSVSGRDSGWKRTWYSSDSDSTVATAALAAPPTPMQVLDLRFDPTDECCHTGFLDSLVRKFSKILVNFYSLLPAPVFHVKPAEQTFNSSPPPYSSGHHWDNLFDAFNHTRIVNSWWFGFRLIYFFLFG